MIVYTVCYAASCILARMEHFYLSGAALLAAAVWLYALDYRRTKNIIHLRALFSLSWVGGQGLACLKLSELAGTWAAMTWLCFFLAFAGFWLAFEILTRLYGPEQEAGGRRRSFSGDPVPVFQLIILLTGLSFASFLLEAAVLGYVPFLVLGVPHAYSEFHLTGVHYLTVSSVLVPALAVLFFHMTRGRAGGLRTAAVLLSTFISLAVPVLCVSRFQFVLAVVLACFTFIALQESVSFLHLLVPALVIVPVYLLLSISRSHDTAYLNSIFEMKQELPVFISQPYIYVANNYDNFDCLVQALTEHTHGLKGLFPLWTITGLKFFHPELVSFPLYVTKKELTTLTLFYDAFYDFGAAGVLLFSCLLGLVSWLLVAGLREFRNPFGFLLYAQMAAYLTFSFFTTWFSNTTVWFYLILSGLMAAFYGLAARRERMR